MTEETQKKSFFLSKTFLIGAAYGVMLWVISEFILHGEPWDGGRSLLYLLALLLGGFVSAWRLGATFGTAYWGIYAGQFLFGFLQMLMGDGDMFPIGAVVLLVYTLPVLIGVWVGRKTQKFNA